MKRLFIALLAVALAIGLAQASDFERALRGILRDAVRGGSAPAQPAPPAAPSAPAQPTPPVAPAQAQPAPGEQLLRALLAGRTSLEEETRIGERIAGNLLGAAPLVRDDGLQRYVNRVGRWVALQSERPDINWRFGVIDSDDINAFAAPGGFIFVTKGLYRRLNNEAELAGVLAHEIGHVLRQHHLKLMQQSQMVAAIGGLLGRQARNESELIQNLIGNGAEIVARGLDKDAEHEADRIGMVLAARAGYDPYALPAVLAEIGHIAGNDRSVSLLFKTHPHPRDRLSHLGEAVGDRFDHLADGKLLAERFYRLR
jgi:predicted Zn-dependent protease